MFDELFAPADQPFEHARMLALETYRAPQVLNAEIEMIFGSEWLCVGRTADVPNVGDYRVEEIPTPTGARSVIVMRADTDTVSVFDNICIHRGAQLLQGCGNEARITCPYHAWVYRLDGTLTGGPYMNDSVEFDGSAFEPSRHSLRALRTEIWEGYVFVSQKTDADPLSPRLTGLTDLLARYRMDSYVPVFDRVDVWDTNWKLLVENFMDAYHIFKVHKDSFAADGDNTRFTHMYPGTDHWAHHRVLNPDHPDMCAAANSSLEDGWRKTIVLAAVFPGLVIQLQPNWMWFLRITPQGTDQVRISWQVAIAPETLADQEDPDAYVESVMKLVHQVNGEDHPIVEGIRRSVDRPQFERGPLSYLERNVYDFDRYIARMLTAT